MGDRNSISSSISSILASPRFFDMFSSRKVYDSETTAISPTSILDAKNSPDFNPFGSDEKSIKSSSSSPAAEIVNRSSICSKPEKEAIGLALVHLINSEKSDHKLSRMVLFGAKLKVQIPTGNPSGVTPDSPARGYFTRQLSLKEMELSEDYTCVITHGPNPKTTHIFDDCVVANCERFESSDDHKKMEPGFEENGSDSPLESFLSYCHTCKERIELDQDIYMFRGEKAFCSHECRLKEMLFEDQEMDDNAF